jgi:hypothetical protein
MRAGNHDSIGRLNATHLANAAAEAAFNPPDGSVAYREDLRAHRVRRDGLWHQITLATTAALGIYVDPVGGNDANDGLTTLTPLLTLEQADALIPLVISHPVQVHLAAGTFALSRPYAFSARVFSGGKILVFADEVWSPAVYTLIAGDVAAGGSSPTVIKGAFIADAHALHFIRVTSGPSAGRTVSVRNNTATDLIPVASLTGFTAGDTYEILDWAVLVGAANVADDGFQLFLLDGSEVTLRDASTREGAWTAQGFRISGAQTFNAFHSRASWVGMRVDVFLILYAGSESLCGLPDPLLTGWGMTLGAVGGALQAEGSAYLQGYVSANGNGSIIAGLFELGSALIGGHASRLSVTSLNIGGAGSPPSINSIPYLLTGAISVLGGQSNVFKCEIVAGIIGFNQYSRTRLYGIASGGGGLTGAPTPMIQSEAVVHFFGEPTWNGWDVGDGMGPVPGSFFDAIGVYRSWNGKQLERIVP